MPDTRTDWLGQEYGVGDLVLYARVGGHGSANMTLARVVKMTDKSVIAHPLKGARWKPSGGRTLYVDTRTGKGIDPFSGTGDTGHGKGIKRYYGYENTETGEWVSADSLWHQTHDQNRHYYAAPWKCTSLEFCDWVEVVKPGAQVVLSVLENITKWTGDVPE